MPNHPAGLALFAFQVGIGQLIDGFVQEGPAAERGLADVEAKDIVGGFVFEKLLERVLDDALGKNVGRVVGRRLLAVSAGEAIYEAALQVMNQATVSVNLLFIFVFGERTPGHEDRLASADRIVLPRALLRRDRPFLPRKSRCKKAGLHRRRQAG